MDCVNHLGTPAAAFCQNCGRALCAQCVRPLAGGQILCEPCRVAWQGYQPPFVAPPSQGPNPAVAAVLGLIPGVGAMYNGQFIKGLIHVVVFAVLIGIAGHYGIFGLFIAAWILYQSFEAYHTAKAMREGQPLPDPLGFNEIGNFINPGGADRPRYPEQNGPEQGAANSVPNAPGSYASGPAGQDVPRSFQASSSGGQNPPSFQAPYEWTPYRPPAPDFTEPVNPANQDTPPVPPAPPMPPICWHRREPMGAIVLIALGVLFLLGKLDIFSGRLLEFTWPVALIALGAWMIVRRLRDSNGGCK